MFIKCRDCESSYCNGCNIYILSNALDNGYFDLVKDDTNTVNISTPVVEIIRCKDCKYVEFNSSQAVCPKISRVVTVDNFCYFGAKK